MPDTFAASHLPIAALNHGSVTESSAKLKTQKYANIVQTHIFTPVAIETSVVLSIQARELLTELRKRIFEIAEEVKETTYLFHQVSVAILCSFSRGLSSPTTSNFYLQMVHLTHTAISLMLIFKSASFVLAGKNKNKIIIIIIIIYNCKVILYCH